MALFPIVPNVSGVPALLRNAQGALDQLTGDGIVTLNGIMGDLSGIPNLIRNPLDAIEDIASGGIDGLIGDAIGGIGDMRSLAGGIFGGFMGGDLVSGLQFGPTQWGVYRGGRPVITFDTCVGVRYRQDWAIADYPIERGGFETYDKVDTPFDVRVRFATGGSISDRAEMLASIDAIAGDLNLYDVITPEKIYTSVNVQGFNYDRRATNGLGVLTVEMALVEVRIQGTANYANVKSPSAASVINGGLVQSSAASSSVQNYAAGGIT